jgi:hypothetical protein
MFAHGRASNVGALVVSTMCSHTVRSHDVGGAQTSSRCVGWTRTEVALVCGCSRRSNRNIDDERGRGSVVAAFRWRSGDTRKGRGGRGAPVLALAARARVPGGRVRHRRAAHSGRRVRCRIILRAPGAERRPDHGGVPLPTCAHGARAFAARSARSGNPCRRAAGRGRPSAAPNVWHPHPRHVRRGQSGGGRPGDQRSILAVRVPRVARTPGDLHPGAAGCDAACRRVTVASVPVVSRWPPRPSVVGPPSGESSAAGCWWPGRRRGAVGDGAVEVLLDLSERSGCACGGLRARIEEGEPPRANATIVVASSGLDLNDQGSAGVCVTNPAGEPAQPGPPALRNTSMPGATLGVPARAQPFTASPSRLTAASSVPMPAPPAHARAIPTEEAPKRTLALTLLPVVVLAAAAALGVGVYAVALRATQSTAASGESQVRTDTAGGRSDSMPVGTARPSAAEATSPAATSTSAAETAAVDSGKRAVAPSAPPNLPDSAPRPAIDPKRRRAPPPIEVVPGRLPQGRRTFTPVDSGRARKRDSSTTAPPPDTIPRT